MNSSDSDTQNFDEKFLAFVSALSHDMKSPLTSIKGYSALLLAEAFGPLNDTQQESIQKISLYVDKAFNSLEMQKKLAIIESGILLAKQESVDLLPIFYGITKKLQPEIEAKKLTLQLNHPKNLPSVKARTHEVYEILSGLTENALSYSLPNSQISISVFSSTNLVKTIINTSTLSPPKNESEGRNPFTFMKLKIIERYIEQFGGEFGEESEEGKGHTVWFTLPIADESAEI